MYHSDLYERSGKGRKSLFHSSGAVDLPAELRAEPGLEQEMLQAPEFVTGLMWGVPRYGHPEGEVYKHVAEVLQNIDRLDINALIRRQLRLVAFVHDTFKYLEDKSHPRDWSKHHAVYARRFLEHYTDDPAALTVTELHDEAYYAWCSKVLHRQTRKAKQRLEHLLSQLGPHRQLYYLFFKCDTLTGDKNPRPLEWFESEVSGIKLVEIN